MQLQLHDTTVSAEHASIYFDGGFWKVRDLGSRNGTYVNARRIDTRTAHGLGAGDALSFGNLRQPAWRLDSVCPPGPVARLSSGCVLTAEGGVLWLPRATEPQACIRFQHGQWILERAEESREVRDGDSLTLAAETYSLELPPWPAEGRQPAESTLDAARSSEPRLRFGVSRDQEHVSLEASLAGHTIGLGARAHNFPLLCLARRRLAERHGGISESECGWVYAQELREALRLDRLALNLQLWRATQAVKRAELPAERLIERRMDAGQLRIGFAELVIIEEERRSGGREQ